MSVRNIFYPNFNTIYGLKFIDQYGELKVPSQIDLEELKDVNVISPIAGDILALNGANKWTNVTPAGAGFNIYNSDGSISDAVRIVNGASNIMLFDNFSNFTVNTNSLIELSSSSASIALTNSVSLSGPTDIIGVLNMNSNRISNVSNAINPNDAVNKNQLDNLNLTSLSDVDIVSPSNNQVLVYNSLSTKWENKLQPSGINNSHCVTFAGIIDQPFLFLNFNSVPTDTTLDVSPSIKNKYRIPFDTNFSFLNYSALVTGGTFSVFINNVFSFPVVIATNNNTITVNQTLNEGDFITIQHTNLTFSANTVFNLYFN